MMNDFSFVALKLKPKLSNLKTNLKATHKENISYGVHIYTGRVVDTASYQLYLKKS